MQEEGKNISKKISIIVQTFRKIKKLNLYEGGKRGLGNREIYTRIYSNLFILIIPDIRNRIYFQIYYFFNISF